MCLWNRVEFKAWEINLKDIDRKSWDCIRSLKTETRRGRPEMSILPKLKILVGRQEKVRTDWEWKASEAEVRLSWVWWDNWPWNAAKRLPGAGFWKIGPLVPFLRSWRTLLWGCGEESLMGRQRDSHSNKYCKKQSWNRNAVRTEIWNQHPLFF